MSPLILASSSSIRAELLTRVRVPFEVMPARIDEDAIKLSLVEQGASTRDIADALAEGKARKIALKHPEVLVLGCDQVLDFKGQVLSKPQDPNEAIDQLKKLSGEKHSLLSAAVIYEDARPIWRHIGQVRLTMHKFSDDWINDYVERNWESVRYSVGGYKIEEEGARLFSRIEGDHFNILGLPLLELLSYLTLRGTLPS